MKKLLLLCVLLSVTACNPNYSHAVSQVELESIFNEMCDHIELNCEGIKIKYTNLAPHILGTAQLYNTGKMQVGINTAYQKEMVVRGIVAHEVSHLVVFTTSSEPHKNHHGSRFNTVCKKLTFRAKVSEAYCVR